MDGFKRYGAALLSSSLILAALPAQPVLASSPSMQRIKGTVGFAGTPDGKQTLVTTGSDIPAGGEAFSNCSSLAVVTLPDGAQLTLGGRTSLVTPASDATAGTLKSGALHYELPGRPSSALVIATTYGTVSIAHGSGYIVTGSTGTQAIVVDGGPNDVRFSTASSAPVLAGGQSALSTGGDATLAPLKSVDNPAIFQFDEGRNPLGTDRSAPLADPASSPASECGAAVVAAGAGGGALALIGLGAAGAIAVAVGHGGGGGGGDATPPADGSGTPTPTPTTVPTPVATATATASSGATATPTATNGGSTTFGAVVLNPSTVLLSPGVGSPADATFSASQANYSGPFTIGQPSCPINLLGAPTSSISGGTISVALPSQAAAVSLLCSVTVTGGGGMSATEPIAIDVSALGLASPTPTPGPGALGPVIANPSSILLNPGVGSPAAQTISVSQANYTGVFSAVLDGCLGVGAPPTIAVSGSNVTVSLPAQTAAVDLGCTAYIIGGGGMTATVPITISVAAAGTPTAAPTSSGSAGSGPLSASPQTILLNPSAVTPATQNVIVSPAIEGPFTATTSCSVPLGAEPLTSVTGNVVTVTAPAQVLTAQVGCSTIVISTVTGNSVTVPILITATGVGPAQATPSPNPSGIGPLFANPGSILVDPGVTTDATQNIEIFDHGFTGTYAVSIAPGCLALQQPSAKLVDGNIATVTVPGQLLDAALLCNVSISDGSSTIEVPITISATALAGLSLAAHFDGVAFRPATLALEREGALASVDVIGKHAPYTASAACPSGTVLDAQITGSRAVVRATSITGNAVCMVTVTGSGGTYGQVPVRITADSFGSRSALQAGRPGSAEMPGTLALGIGEERMLQLGGSGPYAVSGNCGRIADARVDGNVLHVAAHRAGTCSLIARSPGGEDATIPVVVRDGALHRMDTR